MNMESLVCSLELAKKLKKLGVKQESLFSYGKEYKYVDNFELDFYKYTKKEIEYYYAFTASELLELLPNQVNCNTLKIIKQLDNKYCIAYPDVFLKIKGVTFQDDNLSNACSKMLIYLLENKLI